jgi:hypothetical protein
MAFDNDGCTLCRTAVKPFRGHTESERRLRVFIIPSPPQDLMRLPRAEDMYHTARSVFGKVDYTLFIYQMNECSQEGGPQTRRGEWWWKAKLSTSIKVPAPNCVAHKCRQM